MPSTRLRSTGMRLSAETLAILDRHAERLNTSRAGVVEALAINMAHLVQEKHIPKLSRPKAVKHV